MNNIKNIYLKTTFEEIEKINPEITKVKVRILYEGLNRNQSYISKETIENKLIPSIYNIPIVGEWIESKGDFGGHGGKFKSENGEIKFIHTTKPYGVIPNNTDIYWEDINDKSYLCCIGYLWTGRYEELQHVLEFGANQSMEISIEQGEYNDNEGYYEIADAHFSALCILGNDVEPCFEDATISLYEVSNKESFINSFEKISDEINKYINKKEEEDIMAKVKNENEEFSMSVNQIENFIREELSKKKYIYNNYWGEPRESQEYYLQDIIIEENICVVIDDKTWGQYYGIPYSFSGDIITLDYENMKRYIIGDWRPMTDGQTDNSTQVFETIKTEYNKQFEDFEKKIVEKTQQEFDVKKTEEYTTLEKELSTLKEKYSVGKDESKDTNDKKDETFNKEEFETIKNELSDIKEKFSTLETENERLKKFELEKLAEERKIAEDKIFEQYSELKEVEGFETLKDECSKYTLEELDTKLAVLFTKTFKNNKKFSIEDNKTDGNVRILCNPKEEKEYSPYGDLFEKYGK